MAYGKRDLAKERAWRDLVRRQGASGLSVRAFCRIEGRSEASFYFWQRTIRQRDGQRTKSRPPAKLTRIPNSMSSSAQRTIQPPAFVPAVMTSGPPIASPSACTSELRREAAIVIELAGGRVLRFPASVAVERIAELVVALETRTLEARASR